MASSFDMLVTLKQNGQYEERMNKSGKKKTVEAKDTLVERRKNNEVRRIDERKKNEEP